MKLLWNASREGNDCWITDMWYWASDFRLVLHIVDDGRGPHMTRISKHCSRGDGEIPTEVKEQLQKLAAVGEVDWSWHNG